MRSTEPTAGSAAAVQTLVLSQHDAVRRQLVDHLARSPRLAVSGGADPDLIRRTHPRVLVVDLSGVDSLMLEQVLALSTAIGTRLVALASVRDVAQERQVVGAGGTYLLKTVGASGLAQAILGRNALDGVNRQAERARDRSRSSLDAHSREPHPDLGGPPPLHGERAPLVVER